MNDTHQKQARGLISVIRRAVADYMQSEGCSCCRADDAHKEAEAIIAKWLKVPKYKDGSGYNFNKFATKPTIK